MRPAGWVGLGESACSFRTGMPSCLSSLPAFPQYPHANHDDSHTRPFRLCCRTRRAFSAAQLALQAAAGWRCASDLPFCFLLQTMLLVAFNKVRRVACGSVLGYALY